MSAVLKGNLDWLTFTFLDNGVLYRIIPLLSVDKSVPHQEKGCELMWRRISLRARLFLILAGLVIVTLAGGSVMMWYTYQIDAYFNSGILDRGCQHSEQGSYFG